MRDSQDPHTPIWVPGFSYPAQYCIRQTRSLSQKLQVDNVDCIDLDDCMFGSQRAKVKVEDSKSDSVSVKSEHTNKPLRRKASRRSKRRQRSNNLSQTSDCSDCGVKLELDQPIGPADCDGAIHDSIGEVSVLLMEEPAVINDDEIPPVAQHAPLMGGDKDMAQLLAKDGGNVTDPLAFECNDVIPSAQQPMECDNDMPKQLTQQATGGDDNTDTPVLQQQQPEGNDMKVDDNPTPENLVQHSMGSDNNNTLYGLTDSMLLSIEASCDQQTRDTTEICDQGPSNANGTCQFRYEQGNSKVTLCKDSSSSRLHCSAVLKVTTI